jgi:hypothetical protein
MGCRASGTTNVRSKPVFWTLRLIDGPLISPWVCRLGPKQDHFVLDEFTSDKEVGLEEKSTQRGGHILL